VKQVTYHERIAAFVDNIPQIDSVDVLKHFFEVIEAYQKVVDGYESGGGQADKLEANKQLLKPYINDLQVLREYCQLEINALKEQYTLRTVRSYLTRYREAVEVKHGKHPIIVYLALSKNDNSELKDMAKASRQKSTEKRVTITKSDVDSLVKQASSMCGSQNYYIAALGVMTLTGRRAIEVVKSGHFDLAPSILHFSLDGASISLDIEGCSVLRFSGQAKNKGKTVGYNIPVLGSSELILNTVKRLRCANGFVLPSPNVAGKIIDTDDFKKVNNIINKPLSMNFDRQFDGRVYNTKPHILRHIYANYFYDSIGRELRATHSFVDLNDTNHKLAIFKSFLGHSSSHDDSETKAYESLVKYVNSK